MPPHMNPQLLMVEVEYDRVARVCNNVFLRTIDYFIVFGYSKNYKNHENADQPTDPIF